ncbi:sarcosine oxidase [Xylariaceae sp. FL1651]|nr:sarcosine oxidase [Xylariaceae sp. FL1651]
MVIANSESYLIIGAGCFGVSTARYLKATYPDSDVVLLDRVPFPSLAAAAHDLNKIIRTEYEDIMYMNLAIEAMNAWHDDPVLKPFFHETGVVWSVNPTRAQELLDNYEQTGHGHEAPELMSLEEARTRFPILGHCEFQEASNCLWNPKAGWGDAVAALQAAMQAAIESGVHYEVATVSKIDFDKDDVCRGVITAEGRTYRADRVILCAGAHIPWLLADSAPNRPHLQARNRMTAAAALMCTFQADPSQQSKFVGAPVMVHPRGDVPAECIPPGSSSGLGLIKITHQFVYTHKVHHEASNQEISIPPIQAQYSAWSQDVPITLKEKAVRAQHMWFNNSIKGMKPVAYRLCWDLATPSDDWIISPHPAKNLFIASGGSFHAWKFLPTIGKYVTQMLRGTLPQEYTKRWAWDRSMPPVTTVYTPRIDLKDVPGWP